MVSWFISPKFSKTSTFAITDSKKSFLLELTCTLSGLIPRIYFVSGFNLFLKRSDRDNL